MALLNGMLAKKGIKKGLSFINCNGLQFVCV